MDNHNDSKFWVAQDMAFIPWCDELRVICIDGWRESVGIKREIKEAERLGKKVDLVYI